MTMEREQFEIEVLPLRPQLLSLARHILANDISSEDVVQETLLKLWLLRSHLDQYQSIQALAFIITRHLCYNMTKAKRNNDVALEEAHFMAAGQTPEEALLLREENERLLSLIASLPDTQKAILQMKHIDGLEVDEIARITGSSPESIRMNLSRARRKIKKLFSK